MGDRHDDSHLAPPPPSEGDTRTGPPGLRHLSHFVGSIGRFTRLAERQGTRLVDLIERWVEATEEGNRQASRIADTMERIADHADGYLGTSWDPEDEHEDEGGGDV